MQREYAANAQVIFFHSEENLGPAKGRNKLISCTREEWLFFIDNDITIKPEKEWRSVFLRFVKENPSVQVICPALFNVHENSFCVHPKFNLNGDEVSLLYSQNSVTNYFPSGASIVKRTIFEKYGLFDDDLFAFEDYEFAVRLACISPNELQSYSLDEITLIHDHRFQKNSIDKNAVKERYNKEKLRQSFLLMTEKNGVRMNHDWEWWSKKQIDDMTKTKKGAIIKRAIRKVFKS